MPRIRPLFHAWRYFSLRAWKTCCVVPPLGTFFTAFNPHDPNVIIKPYLFYPLVGMLSMCTKPIKDWMLFEPNQIHNSSWSHCGSNSWRRCYSSCTMWVLVGAISNWQNFGIFKVSILQKSGTTLSCNFRNFVTFQNVTKCVKHDHFI
jgi:hypothetical protein